MRIHIHTVPDYLLIIRNIMRLWVLGLILSVMLTLTHPLKAVSISLAPVVGAVNQFQNSTLAKWSEQISKLQEQINILRDHKRCIEDQLQTQRDQYNRLKEYIEFFGNPKKVFRERISWKTIDIDEVLNKARGLTEVLQDPLKGIRGVIEIIPKIYEQIPKKTSYGTEVSYTPEVHARYSLVDDDLEKVHTLSSQHHQQREKLYRDLEQCMQALKESGTDAEVQKLHAHINAINGQIGLLESYRADAHDQLQAHAVHAHNQSEKEQATNVERHLQETLDESDRFEQLACSIKLRRSR